MSDMQEEIKEILDKLQKVANRETASRNALMEMKDKDYQLLLDYITNLQEENKKLKELCNKYEEEHSTTFEYWKHLVKEDYKSRCEKAIEYIDRLTNGLYKILELNKFMVNCESEKVRMKTIMKQYSLIYEILGIPELGLARGTKNNLDKEK